MWLVTVCFVSVLICCSAVNGQVNTSSNCEAASVEGFVEGGSSSRGASLTQGGCFLSSLSSRIPPAVTQDLLNPRYTRAILAAKTRVLKNTNIENLRVKREIQPGEYNQDPAYFRLLQNAQQRGYTPQGSFVYHRNNGQELMEQNNEPPPQQVYSRSQYQSYDGSFAPRTSHQDQYPTINFNRAIPSSHTFGARRCPYCNSPLPSEPVHQHQQIISPRSNPVQQNPNLLSNNFNQQQQYTIPQGQSGYQNVNPAIKTTPTTPSEEMCPYYSGSIEEEPKMSPSSGYNETLQQTIGVRGSSGVDRYPPSIGNTAPYLSEKNLQVFPNGPTTPKNMKPGTTSQQSMKYMKVQRTEGNEQL